MYVSSRVYCARRRLIGEIRANAVTWDLRGSSFQSRRARARTSIDARSMFTHFTTRLCRGLILYFLFSRGMHATSVAFNRAHVLGVVWALYPQHKYTTRKCHIYTCTTVNIYITPVSAQCIFVSRGIPYLQPLIVRTCWTLYAVVERAARFLLTSVVAQQWPSSHTLGLYVAQVRESFRVEMQYVYILLAKA